MIVCGFCLAAFVFYLVALTVLVPPFGKNSDWRWWLILAVGGTLYLAFMLLVVLGLCA